jgi:hypothetical protein
VNVVHKTGTGAQGAGLDFFFRDVSLPQISQLLQMSDIRSLFDEFLVF